MKLLKIGRFDVPRSRWLGATEVFDRIEVFSESERPLSDARFRYHALSDNPVIRRINIRLFAYALRHRADSHRAWLSARALFLLNYRKLRAIGRTDYNFVYSSYNDYDESGLFTVLLQPFLRRDVLLVRACKETRPTFNWFERRCFEIADVVVLNHMKNVGYFQEKYPTVAWSTKRIHVGLDEDCRSARVVGRVALAPKLSAQDGKLHAVILCGVAKSDESDPRSGARQHYLPMIRGLLATGIKVHLHTQRIEMARDGRNHYRDLQELNPDSFFLEAPLAFDDEDPSPAYGVLSRYDVGVLHNFSAGSGVSHFDRVNIPNRFYEYQQAGVIPILRRGTAEVVEEIVTTHRCGVVYDEFRDITFAALAGIVPYRPSFEDYCRDLFLGRLGEVEIKRGAERA